MDSAKSHHKPKERKKHVRRKHLNKQFYNSKTWRDTRQSYLREYQAKIFSECTKGYWTVNGIQFILSPHQQTAILSLSALPCELCLKYFVLDVYSTMEPGHVLDHIKPVNPENALERVFIGATALRTIKSVDNSPDLIEGELKYMYGDPFDFDNLQFLCKRHHDKKSQRER